MQNLTTTVGDITRFLQAFPECKGKIDVKTRHGYYPIEAAAITAYNSDVIKLVTESGESIKVSPDHLMLSNNIKWIKTKDLNIGDFLFTEMGATRIRKITHLKGKENLYDLQVGTVHEYYANGLVSHNSTGIDALTYVLYGKPFRRINKPQLVNSINKKELVVEVEFSTGSKEYLIRRGQKPGIFEIYQNGVLLNQDASIRDYQEYLEKNILKLNFKSFTQIVILGSRSYVPFMQLPVGQRREVIEDILDLQIFSTMNTLLKEKVLLNKAALKDVKYQSELIQEKIALHKEYMKSLNNNNKKQIEINQNKIQDLKNEIMHAKPNIEAYTVIVKGLLEQTANASEIRQNGTELLALERDITSKISKLQKEITFYDHNDSCPTCKQDIEHSFKCESIADKNNLIESLKLSLIDVENSIAENSSKLDQISSLQNEISDYNVKIQTENAKINSALDFISKIEAEIVRLSEEHKSDSSDKDKLELLKEDLRKQIQKHEALVSDRSVLDVLSVLLKDGGIKSRIIKQYIPIMNKLINKYLAALELVVSFELDENFNETVKSRHRDEFSYDSFSEGEKGRLDLAIMFAWRAITKIRNGASTNLLILDEVFDSVLDASGTEELMKLLNIAAVDTNIFVISHKGDTMADKYSNIIEFVKQKNFSYIKGSE